MPTPTIDSLPMLLVARDLPEADVGLQALDDALRLEQVGLVDGEREVGQRHGRHRG